MVWVVCFCITFLSGFIDYAYNQTKKIDDVTYIHIYNGDHIYTMKWPEWGDHIYTMGWPYERLCLGILCEM